MASKSKSKKGGKSSKNVSDEVVKTSFADGATDVVFAPVGEPQAVPLPPVEVVKTALPPAKRLLPHNLISELDALADRVDELEKKLNAKS